MKKRRISIILVLVTLFAVNFSVLGVSSSQYLRSRLIGLAAKLYQEISFTISSDLYYSIGLLPMLDVNGEDPDLVLYLHDQIEQVLANYPSVRLTSAEDVMLIWNDLLEENLTESEIFTKIGERLKISGVVMTSMVTHPQHYSINGIVVNTRTGARRELELVVLDRQIVESIPIPRRQPLQIPGLITEPSTQIQVPQISIIPEEDPKTPETQVETETNDTPSGETTRLVVPVDEQKTPIVTTPSVPPVTVPPVTVTPVPPAQQQSTPIQEPAGGYRPRQTLTLQNESPKMNNLLMGFDFGDFNGDGQLDVVLSTGLGLQVRDLTDYRVKWSMDRYQPAGNDHKILTVDITGDGHSEIVSFGNLIKLVGNQLVNQQQRFAARPVSQYSPTAISVFDHDTIFIVNHQGLIIKRYPLGEGVGKRFAFADLHGDGGEYLVTTMQGVDDQVTVQIFQALQTLQKGQTLPGRYSHPLHVIDLNNNGRPEIYLSRNVFDGTRFMYSKIFVFESVDGEITLIAESPELDYFIVDFSSYPKKNPTQLAVGGMYFSDKNQSIQEIQSGIFYYTLDRIR